MGTVDLSGYVDVATRIGEFRAKYPDGSLQPLDAAHPFEVITIGERTFVVVVAAAYRTPDDPRPGVGMAWEPLPGRTAYTRDSELMNAETSAWGRAIVAVLAADARAGIASAEEVAHRSADRSPSPEPIDRPAAYRKLNARADESGLDAQTRSRRLWAAFGKEHLHELSDGELRRAWQEWSEPEPTADTEQMVRQEAAADAAGQ